MRYRLQSYGIGLNVLQGNLSESGSDIKLKKDKNCLLSMFINFSQIQNVVFKLF